MATTKKTSSNTIATNAKSEEDMTPQELEIKKAADAAKAEEKKQARVKELIKTKKYFLPIK